MPRDRLERTLRRHRKERLCRGVPTSTLDRSQENFAEERFRVLAKGPSEGARHSPERLRPGRCARTRARVFDVLIWLLVSNVCECGQNRNHRSRMNEPDKAAFREGQGPLSALSQQLTYNLSRGHDNTPPTRLCLRKNQFRSG